MYRCKLTIALKKRGSHAKQLKGPMDCRSQSLRSTPNWSLPVAITVPSNDMPLMWSFAYAPQDTVTAQLRPIRLLHGNMRDPIWLGVYA
jgi:hypothetical protein